MFSFLSVVPIIIPSDPSVRAEVAAELAKIGDLFVLAFFLMCVTTGISAIVKGLVRLARFIYRKIRKE